jgi:hypothetical protein
MAGPKSMFCGKRADGSRYPPVRIAVLDSGIDFEKMTDYRTYIVKKEALNFVDGNNHREALKDSYGHGTAVAYQIIRTCPTAKLYIGKVVEEKIVRVVNGVEVKEPEVVKSAVARAIRHAADPKGWRVDIINMSFGWDGFDNEVSKALQYAKANGVLLFASTSNYGTMKGGRILYPGWADEVICVDAAKGDGELAGFNPSTELNQKDVRLVAPGLGLVSPTSSKVWDGTSLACPILVGMAAWILEFARQTPLDGAPSVAEYLKERQAMADVLRAMSVRKGADKFYFLNADKLLTAGGRDGGNGLLYSRRSNAAYDLVKILRDTNKTIGNEIWE